LQVLHPYDWRLSERNVWKVEQLLIDWPHRRLAYDPSRVERLRRRYIRFREEHGYKPWKFYRGRERWAELPPEFRARG
jgi:hypothetical protein